MEYTIISGTEMKASRIAQGTWAIGGWMWGGTDERESIRTIHVALDTGINLIDTAPVYGFGVSEEIVGKAIEERGHREKVFIATKVGLEWHNGSVSRNASPDRIRKEVQDSLRRLRTDYIDIYQVHWPDLAVPIEETARTMQALLDEGLIRAIGVSNYSVEQMKQFASVAELHTVQPLYNLFERQIDRDVLPYVREQNRVPSPTGLSAGTLDRDNAAGHKVHRRRPPPVRPEIPAAALRAISECGSATGGSGAEKIRETRDGSCRALGLRYTGNDCGALGRTPSCRTGSGSGRPRLETRRGYAHSDRSDSAEVNSISDRFPIHGAAGKKNRRGLRYMKAADAFLVFSDLRRFSGKEMSCDGNR
jgi:aryl-alcohol dehydrogenase-like predicted oxidoreductase